MSPSTLKNHLLFLILLLTFSLSACGGKSSGGGAKEQSALEELQGMSASLQGEVDKTMSPITLADEIIADFENLPKTLTLTPEQFKGIIVSTMQGEMKLPEGLGEDPVTKLKAFADKLTQFKESIASIPDNATALGVTLGKSLVKVPTLVTTLETKAKAPVVPMVFSAADKKKAEQEAAEAKKISDELIAKIKGLQTTVTELPSKATNALSNFSNALKNIGIDNVDALMSAGKTTATEQVEQVQNDNAKLLNNAKDLKAGAKDISKLAKDPAGVAKDLANDAKQTTGETLKESAE